MMLTIFYGEHHSKSIAFQFQFKTTDLHRQLIVSTAVQCDPHFHV